MPSSPAGVRSARSAGFTLVELMIVIAIIAVLISIAVPLLAEARRRSNEGAALGTLRSVAAAQALFRSLNGRFGLLIRPSDSEEEQQTMAPGSGDGRSFLDRLLAAQEAHAQAGGGELPQPLPVSFDLDQTPSDELVQAKVFALGTGRQGGFRLFMQNDYVIMAGTSPGTKNEEWEGAAFFIEPSLFGRAGNRTFYTDHTGTFRVGDHFVGPDYPPLD